MTDTSPLEITRVPIGDLIPHPDNPRRGDVDQIAASLRKHGQYKPVVVQTSTGYLIAGNHTRLGALRLLEEDRAAGVTDSRWQYLDVVYRDLDDEEATRILLVDNRTSDLGGYDSAALLDLLGSLPDLEATGYSTEDLEELTRTIAPVGDAAPVSLTDEDEIPELPDERDVVTRPGDVWHLGPHRIICGDSRDPITVTKLLDGQKINLGFTSPPYASQRKYDESSGFRPVPPDEYVAWFADVAGNVAAHLADDGSWFVNIKEHVEDGGRHLYVRDLTVAHVRRWGWTWVDELIWNHGGTPGQFIGRFKNGYESVYHFARVPGAKIKHRPRNVAEPSDAAFSYQGLGPGTGTGNIDVPAHVARGEGMALPSNVLRLRHGRHAGEAGIDHAAMFPVRLPAWFLKAYTDEGDLVYDPFMGAGTTVIAAHNEKRIAMGVEISPAYCDTICRRYEQHTGTVPLRQRAGSTDLEPVRFGNAAA